MGRRDQDPRPPVELWGVEATPADAPTTIQVGGRHSRRTPLIAVVAAVALVAGGLALGGDDDDERADVPPREERDNRQRTELKPPAGATSTTRRPTTTTTTTTTLPAGPVLPVPTGAALLLAGTGTGWTWLDLDSGRRLDVDVGTRDPYGLVPVSGGFVGLSGSTAEYHPLPTGIPVSLGPADQVLSSGSPDTVWLLRTTFDGPTMAGVEAILVDLDGNQRGDTVTLPAAYPIGGTDRGLVFSRGGRTYVGEASGIRPLALGDALRINRTSVVVLSCDDQAVCAPEIVDIASGSSRRLAPIPNPYEMGIVVLLSDDGDLAVGSYQERLQSLQLYDAEGRAVGAVDVSPQGEPRWLPNGMGLVAMSIDGRGVVRISLADGGVVEEPIVALGREFAEFLYVIPR